jgi:ribosomal protein S8
MNNPTTNYVIADFVSNLNFGIIRNVKCIRVNKTPMAIRITHLLYLQGVLRTYKVEENYIIIYYKFSRSRHIITKIKVISNLVYVVVEH